MDNNPNHLPALDDLELRKTNTKKIVDAVDKIGDFVKTYQKEKRIGMVTAIVFLGLILLIAGGSLFYVYINSDGTFFDSIYDVDAVTQRYVCWVEGYDNLTFKQPSQAIKFKELFNQSDTTCVYFSVKKKR